MPLPHLLPRRSLGSLRSAHGFALAFIVPTALAFGALPSPGDDWPQFQGVKLDNKSGETGLLSSWPKEGPKLAWTFRKSGIGYSSPSIVKGRIYLTGGRDGKAQLLCLDAKDGKEIWSLDINDKVFDFEGNAWGAGPRAAASVDGDFVYALAGDGKLICATTEGKLVWRVDAVKDLGGSVKNTRGGEPKTIGWGHCWAPLVDGKNLICTPGNAEGKGLFVALDKRDGKLVWRSKELDEEATYASPILATIHGVRQYITMTQRGVASVASKDGKLLWHYTRRRPYSNVVIPSPLCDGQYVYASTGDGCDKIKITKSEDGSFAAEKVYAGRRMMKNSIGGFVLHEGHVYGTSKSRGWICQNFETGKIVWYERSSDVADGSLIFADGHLYLYGERTAEVSLIEASSEKWNLKGHFALPESSKLLAPSGKNWTRPVIADGMLYLRDQELLFCYRIKKTPQTQKQK